MDTTAVGMTALSSSVVGVGVWINPGGITTPSAHAALTVNPSNTVDTGASIQFNGFAASDRVIVIHGFSGQTADLTDWAVNSNTALASVAASGVMSAPGYTSIGTTFTVSGCGTSTGLTGGSTAGQFTGGSATCTPVITTNLTAPHGYSCWMNDQTTATALFRQTANTTTTITFTAAGTVGATDVINFGCMEY